MISLVIDGSIAMKTTWAKKTNNIIHPSVEFFMCQHLRFMELDECGLRTTPGQPHHHPRQHYPTKGPKISLGKELNDIN